MRVDSCRRACLCDAEEFGQKIRPWPKTFGDTSRSTTYKLALLWLPVTFQFHLMPSQHSLVVLFDVFVFAGIGLSLCTFLPAILSKNVYRSIGWYSLMTAWLVYSLSYALLIGKQEGPDPPFGLCVFQSLLVYATPPL